MEAQEFLRVDQEKLKFYSEKLGEFLEEIKPGDKVLVNCHSDADGVTGGGIADCFMEENKEEAQVGISHHVLDTPGFYETAKDYDHVIVSDLWVDSRVGHQENLRHLSAEGVNVAILDHHDERFPVSKIRFDGRHNHRIPETIGSGQKGKILYVTPNRLNSPIGKNLTGALITYLMLAPFSKSGLERMRKFLPISISGDYARDDWPELLKEIGHQELLDTLGHALNGGHAINSVSNIVTAMKKAETVERLLELEEVKVLMDILRFVRERIKDVDSSEPFLVHTHLPPGMFQDKVFKHQIVKPEPEISPIVADELRQLLKNKMVLATQVIRGDLRLNFRSSSGEAKFNTRRLAQKFGGDGHHQASGAIISASEMSTEQALRVVKELIEEENAKYRK